MLEAFDAELLVLHRDRRLVLAGDGHERREIGALARQLFRELEADSRRGGIRVDAVVEQAEAVIPAHLFIPLAHIRHFALLERDAERIERRTPDRAVRIGARDHHQALGFFAGIGRALIGDIGGGRRALEQERTLAVIAGAQLQDGLGQPQPIGAVVGRHHDDLPEDLHAGAEVVALEGGIRLAAQHRGRFRDLPGIGLDLRLQLDGGIGEIVAVKLLVGGNGGNGRQQNERGGERTAGEREHGVTSIPVGRGNPNGLSQHECQNMSRS